MSYSIKASDASLQDALRRIAIDQIEAAIAEIDDEALDVSETVHQVRKRCKKLRGLVRLVRPAFGDYAAENGAFRDAARRLSELRDADVMVETYDALAGHFEGEVDRRALGQIRRSLTLRRQERAARGDGPAMLAGFRDEMKAARDRAEGWKIAENGWPVAAAGLERTYGRARKALRKARKNPTDAGLHELRKRVKYHRYHARLLRKIFPGPMEAHAEAADRLGDALGDHHDLAVFGALLREKGETLAPRETVEVALGLAERRKAFLAEVAFGLGARLLAEPGEALAARWGACWHAWHEAPKPVREASAA
jgi:CHAD domain-containing protein